MCRGRVPGVSGGVWRVCRGCAAGVCRVCRGRVAGVCGPGWKQCAPGRATPPPLLAPSPVLQLPLFPRDESRRRALRLLRVSSTRVVRLPLPADCPRGLPLFFRVWPPPSLTPGSCSARPQGLALPSPWDLFFLLFSPGIQRHATAKTRKIKDTQDTRAAAFRRARRTSLLFATAVPTAPHRGTRNSNFHPPAKNTPPPLGDPAHGPEWMPGVHLGVCALGRRPPSCALGWSWPAARLPLGFPRRSRLRGAKAAPASAVHAAAYKSQVRVVRGTRATEASACVNGVVADAGLVLIYI